MSHRANYRLSEIESEPLPYEVEAWAMWVPVLILATFCLVLAFVAPVEKEQEQTVVEMHR